MNQVVDTFSKNATEQIKVDLSEYEGYQLFSFRAWTETKAGENVPTKKGLTLRVDLFPEFKRAVEKLEAAILEAGLLDLEDL